jgi:hypothetical protein
VKLGFALELMIVSVDDLILIGRPDFVRFWPKADIAGESKRVFFTAAFGEKSRHWALRTALRREDFA